MNKLKLLLITLLLLATLFTLVILCVIVTVYFSNTPRIEGRYITTEDKSLRPVRLKLKFYQDDRFISEYETRLRKDGTFSVKVKETGQYYLDIHCFRWERPPWFAPVLSNANFYIPCDLKRGKVVDIGEHYVLEGIQVISPANNEEIVKLEGLVFEWKEVPTADFYTLEISRVKSREDYNFELLIRTVLFETKISYKELQSLPLLKDHSDFTKQIPFNKVFNTLSPGEYRINVSANKLSTDKTHIVGINQNRLDFETYFYIK